MKDSLQKERLFKHFSAQNWYTQIEVPVFFRGGLDESRKLITDVDVIALRPGRELRWELVLGDCKTLKGVSPANRAIWLRGLMDHFNATQGIILLKLRQNQKIEPDHKRFASSLNINLLDENEFAQYDRATVYPAGTSEYLDNCSDFQEIRLLPKKYPKLKHFVTYLIEGAWNEQSYFELLRSMIGEGKAISKEIDPVKQNHLSLVLEASSMFAVGLAASTGILFNQYLQPDDMTQLDSALKVNIWGGRSQYKFYEKLRHELLIAKGITDAKKVNELRLPHWDDFIQLVRNILESPFLAFSVPQILRSAAIDVMGNRPFLEGSTVQQLSLLKIAMLVTKYYCYASSFPPDTVNILVKMFADRQSFLVHKDAEETIVKQDDENSNKSYKSKPGPAQKNLPGLNQDK